jgi:hypothetical protein
MLLTATVAARSLRTDRQRFRKNDTLATVRGYTVADLATLLLVSQNQTRLWMKSVSTT